MTCVTDWQSVAVNAGSVVIRPAGNAPSKRGESQQLQGEIGRQHDEPRRRCSGPDIAAQSRKKFAVTAAGIGAEYVLADQIDPGRDDDEACEYQAKEQSGFTGSDFSNLLVCQVLSRAPGAGYPCPGPARRQDSAAISAPEDQDAHVDAGHREQQVMR